MDDTDSCRFYTSLPTEALDALTLSIETEPSTGSDFARDARISSRGQGPDILFISGEPLGEPPASVPIPPPPYSSRSSNLDVSEEGLPSSSLHTLPKTSPDLANAVRKSDGKSLASLPNEILLAIMMRLEGSELYLLQQTASVFSRIFSGWEFFYYHTRQFSRMGRTSFNPDALSYQERIRVTWILQRCLHCKSCARTRERKEWDKTFVFLHERIYCDGCRKLHPRFLFPPASLQGPGPLNCLGRIGSASLCAHSTSRTSVTWRAIESTDQIDLVCDHPSHQPSNHLASSLFQNSDKYAKEHISVRPRMVITKQNPADQPPGPETCPTTDQRTCTSSFRTGYQDWGTELQHTDRERAAACSIAYAWDLPLLNIDQKSSPTVESIQQTLQSILKDRMKLLKACEHIVGAGHLRSFIREGICSCFTDPGRYIHPFSKGSRDDCFCQRKRHLTCRDCGVVYAWYLAAGHIMLLHRYIWNIHLPTSPAWIALLDENSYKDRFLGKETQHVLWCNNLGCAGGIRRRFATLAKQRAGIAAMWDEGQNDCAEGRHRAEMTGYWHLANRPKWSE